MSITTTKFPLHLQILIVLINRKLITDQKINNLVSARWSSFNVRHQWALPQKEKLSGGLLQTLLNTAWRSHKLYVKEIFIISQNMKITILLLCYYKTIDSQT